MNAKKAQRKPAAIVLTPSENANVRQREDRFGRVRESSSPARKWTATIDGADCDDVWTNWKTASADLLRRYPNADIRLGI